VNEADWNRCTDLQKMLEFLRGKASAGRHLEQIERVKKTNAGRSPNN
jgi:hypothetical protein